MVNVICQMPLYTDTHHTNTARYRNGVI